MSQIGQIYYNIPNVGSSITADYLYNGSGDVLKYIGASQLTKVGVQAPPGTQMVLNQIKQIMIGRTGIYELDEDISITELYFVRPQNYIEDKEEEDKAIENGLKGIEEAMNTRKSEYLTWTNNLVDSWIDIPGAIDYWQEELNNAQEELAEQEALLVQLNQELEGLDETSSEYVEKQQEIINCEDKIAELENHVATCEANLATLRACAADEQKMQSIEDVYLASYTEARAEYYRGINGIYKADEPGDLDNVIIDYIWE